VHKGYASSSLLDTYQAERLPVIAEMLDLTTDLLKKTIKSGGELKRGDEFRQMGVNCRSSPIVYEDETEGRSNGHWPAYSRESESAARAGDRAPDSPVSQHSAGEEKDTNLFSIFSPTQHTALIFPGLEDQLASIALVLRNLPEGAVQSAAILKPGAHPPPNHLMDMTLVDKMGHTHSGYHVVYGVPCIIVVRPDGVVGARVRSAEGFEEYFKRLLA